MQQVIVSPEFKKKATRAVAAIVFFVVIYIMLVALAVGLAVLCGYLAVAIVTTLKGFAGLLLALGVFGVGLLTVYFLIKFMFTAKKTDLSGFTEITREEEPKLFALIDDVVNQAGTDFPKKVFLSHDVNASVFYNSSFWSMFLPVRKNLNIGLGLMNAVTTDELKGIIAHEFGHFSQRSMKVGSYVYSVNYIIHNMLYDNEGYEKVVGKLASVNGWVTLPLMGGVKIVQGIQFILQQVYRVVNVNYLALSREMEFHADEVAARIAGADAITTSLVRLDLAAKSFHAVLNFYGKKISTNQKPENIYPLHTFALTAIATENGLEFQNSFPMVTPESVQRFNKSKINIDNQWASHPSNEDRINRINGLQLQSISLNNTPSITLLTNSEESGKRITGKLFSAVEYSAPATLHLHSEFETEFMADKENHLFPKVFNNYFDDHELPEADITDFSTANDFNTTPSEIFADDKVDLVYTIVGLENDLKLLETIQNKNFGIKSFDYENTRYRRNDATALKPRLNNELEVLNSRVKENDLAILNHYLIKAGATGRREDYLDLYHTHVTFNKWYDDAMEKTVKLYNAFGFLQRNTPFEEIEKNLRNAAVHEIPVKETMTQYIANTANHTWINTEQLDKLEQYCNRELRYFDGQQYYNDSLDILFTALGTFNETINSAKFGHKKRLLNFMTEL